MRTVLVILVLAAIGLTAYLFIPKSSTMNEPVNPETAPVTVVPIAHATAVLRFPDAVVYTDPTGGADAFSGQPAADLVLVTDIHGDHLNAETLAAVLGEATLVVPDAVRDELPEELALRATVMANGDTLNVSGFTIVAVPMYNVPESEDAYHPKGRGNGYIVERDGYRVYIAGDTGPTPEMRALTDIDLALVPMNLPYTMTVDEAAEAVLEFAPTHVYPYHYRGQDGLADVNRFRELVTNGNPEIEVVLLNWYPEE